MELQREFRYIKVLDPSEKRIIRIIGNALAGEGGSQVMELFQQLNTKESLDKADLPGIQATMNGGLSTISMRLYAAIQKGVQYSEAGKTVTGKLNLLLFETQFLFARGLPELALQAAEKGEKLALEFGMYTRVKECIEWQRRLWMQFFPADITSKLHALKQREEEALKMSSLQLELQHFQSLLIAARRLNRLATNKPLLKQISTHEVFSGKINYTDLYTESLAADVKGLYFLADKKGEAALQEYTSILKKWQGNNQWLHAFSWFYISLFTNYQLSVFWGTLSSNHIRSYLSLLPNDKELSPRDRLHFQRIRYGHLITMGLNSGQFSLVYREIPLIERWLEKNKKQLPISSQLAFRYNICISFFLGGKFQDAFRVLQPLLAVKPKGSREDILYFSRILQAVLLFQLDKMDLGEYILRSTRELFKRNERQSEFEAAILRYLGLMMDAGKKQQPLLNLELQQTLSKLSDQSSGPYPLLGINEIRCWVESRISGKPIQKVFEQFIVKQDP